MRREEARNGSAVTGAPESYGNQKRLSVYLNGKPLDLMPEVGVDYGLKDILPAGAYPFVYGGCLIVFILVCLFLIRNFNEKTISA